MGGCRARRQQVSHGSAAYPVWNHAEVRAGRGVAGRATCLQQLRAALALPVPFAEELRMSGEISFGQSQSSLNAGSSMHAVRITEACQRGACCLDDGCMHVWRRVQFTVVYPSLARHLAIGGIYVRLLLDGADAGKLRCAALLAALYAYAGPLPWGCCKGQRGLEC